MHTARISEESTTAQHLKSAYTAKAHPTSRCEASIIEKRSTATTLSQRVAIGFAAGTVATVALVLFSHVLSWFGPAPKGPISFPVSFEPPGIYRLLFWGGLWGLLFGFFKNQFGTGFTSSVSFTSSFHWRRRFCSSCRRGALGISGLKWPSRSSRFTSCWLIFPSGSPSLWSQEQS